jgi:Flp pilus assembly protein TadG
MMERAALTIIAGSGELMNRVKPRGFLKSDDGTGMVEFALAASLFLMLIMGIVEFGLASWQKNAAASDAREGARYAIVRGSKSGRIATAESVAKYIKSRSALDTAGLAVYTTWTPATKVPGSIVTVSVAHTVPRLGPIVHAHRDSVTSTMQVYF